MSPLPKEAFDTEKEGEEKGTVATKPTFCPTVLNNVYYYFDSILDKYLWKDESLSTADRPIFSKSERYNIFFYITGIMCYKFGLEQYNGAVKALALDRFDKWNYPKFTYSGYLDGFNAATQSIGSIIVGPLMTIFPIKSVLAASLFVFAVISMLIMCIEKANGGTFPTSCTSNGLAPPICTGATPGNWDPVGIIPIFVFSGIPYGSIEIVRRIIPQQIVGGNELKLKKLDSLVHIYYEVAGTTGAFFSAYTSLLLGKAYGPVITPILYVFSGLLFWNIVPPKSKEDIVLATGSASELTFLFLKSLWYAFYGFGESIYQGALIIFLEKKYQWLIWGYTIPLVMHRYIENGVASVYAKSVLFESAYASFIVSGSNLGELTGAAVVFFNLKALHTPLPTVRWDALVLNFTWLYYNTVTPASCKCDAANAAGIMAAIMWFISAGWAAGDVSMSAYIQSNIPKIKTPGVVIANALPSVMSFLYVSYIIIYAVISPMIGVWLDAFELTAKMYDSRAKKAKAIPNTGLAKEFTALAAQYRKDALDQYFYYIAGVFFSLISIFIFLNTFIPKGSWKLNPTLEEEGDDEAEAEGEGTFHASGEVATMDGSKGYTPVAPAAL